MTYRLKTIADGANLFYPMDETSGTTMVNYGTKSLNGTYTVSPAAQPPIAARSFRSINLSNTTYNVPLSNLMSVGNDDLSFSIELWLRANVTPTSTHGIFFNGTQGLSVTQSKIKFSVSFTVSGLVTVEYVVPDWLRNYHIVATYTPNQLSLHVNGDLAASVDVPPGNKLSLSPASWGNTTTPDIDIEGLALYFPTLPPAIVADHYRTGTDYISLENILGLDSAQTFIFSDRLANIDHQESFPQDGTWPGLISGLEVLNGVLTAPENTTGTWTYAVPLDQYGTIDSSRIDWTGWQGTGTIVVESSLDLGVTWSACTNHASIPGIGSAFNGVGKVVQIRATLVGQGTGATRTPLYDLSMIFYEARTQRGWDSKRVSTITGDVDLQSNMAHPQHRSAILGAKFKKAGSAKIEADVDNAVTVYAIEAWIRRDNWTTGTEYIIDARNSATNNGILSATGLSTLSSLGWSSTYINGVAATPSAANMPIGKWVHFIGNLTTPSANPVYLNIIYSGTASSRGENGIGYVTLHPAAFTSTTAASRYAAFSGGVRLAIADTDQVAISEDVDTDRPEAVLMYSHAWSITGGG